MTKFLVESDILLYAFRYALGRKSYAPLVVFDNLRDNIKRLSDRDLNQIYDEIVYTERLQQNYNTEGSNLFGDDINQKVWIELREFIGEEIEKRSKNA